MKGPERVSWLRYYIAQPIISICNALGERLSTLWIKLTGGWYCEYCCKVHNRRVYKYNCLDTNLSTATGSLRDISDEPGRFVCSLGRDAVLHEDWKPLNIMIGDKIIYSIKTAWEALNNRGN